MLSFYESIPILVDNKAVFLLILFKAAIAAKVPRIKKTEQLCSAFLENFSRH